MTLALFVLIQYQSVTDRRMDRQTERRADISAIAVQQRMHGLLRYRAGKNSCLSLSVLRPSPRLPTGALLLDPTGRLRLPSPRGPRLPYFTPPNLKSWIRPWTWCLAFHSRDFSQPAYRCKFSINDSEVFCIVKAVKWNHCYCCYSWW